MRTTALFLSLALMSVASAQPTTQNLRPTGQLTHRANTEVHYASRQTLENGVTLAKLSNGMTVIVQENHAAPVATVRCFVNNTGSAYEGKYLGMGISHVLEHLVAGGSTSKRSEEEIQKIINSLGGRTNAYTSNDVTAYYIDCPAKRVGIAIELVADSMQYAIFVEKEYVREMEVVQRELEMGEAEPGRVMYQAMKSLLYTQHPIRHPTIGYLTVLQKIKRDDVLDFYKDRYVPQNMVFVVVGDIDTKRVLDQVLAGFKDFRRTTERVVTLPEEPDQASPRSTRIEMEGKTSRLAMAWPTVALQDPDLYPLDVASFVLTHGDSSRLVRRLKIDQPLVTSVTSSSYTPGFVRGWFDVQAEFEPKNLETVRAIILEEIERLKAEPVGAAELAKVKRQVSAEHVFAQQTVQAQAGMLAGSFRSTGDPLFDQRYVQGIRTVTADQIQRAASKYLLPERLDTVVLEPIGHGKTVVTQTDDTQAESPVIRKQLANGLTVLLKRHPVLPMVSIQAFARAGALSDTDSTAGLASLATAVMEKGTEKYTGPEIAEFFDSIGGSFGMGSQRNSSYAQCTVLAEDFEPALDRVHQVLFHPTFPEAEFSKVRSLRLTGIAARGRNPQAEIMDFWAASLPKNSPFSHTATGTVATVGKLTIDNCRRFHRTYIVPNNMVLAIFGDIDVETTMKRIEASFGQIPKSEAFKAAKFPEVNDLSTSITKHLTTQKKGTAMIMLAYPTVSIYDEKTRSALEVFSAVLASGSGSRLHKELRGEGLVYYVFGFQLSGFAPGFYAFLSQTRPDTLDEVVKRIRAGVTKIRDEGIPADEFEKAKAKLIASHGMSNATASAQAFQAALDELYGFGYDYDKGYDERIAAVTVDDVVSFLTKHFDHSVLVTSAPEAAPAKSKAANGR